MAELRRFRISLINYSNYSDHFRNGQSPIGLRMTDSRLTEIYGNFSDELSQAVNFEDGDGINSSIIVNEQTYFQNCQNANYALIFLTTKLDNGRLINSLYRTYFVIKKTHLNTNVYQLELKRDILADNRIKISKLNGKINRGILPPTNPFFFNPEGNQFNQIKSHEILLKDNSNVGWIVGYLARNDEGQSYSLNISSDSIIDYGGIPNINSLDSHLVYAINNRITKTNFRNKISLFFDGNFFWGTQSFGINFSDFFNQLTDNWELLSRSSSSNIIFKDLSINDTSISFKKNFVKHFIGFLEDSTRYPAMKNSILNTILLNPSFTDTAQFNLLNGLIYEQNGNNYRVRVVKKQTIRDDSMINISNNNAVQTALDTAAELFAEEEDMQIVGNFSTGQMIIQYDEYEVISELIYGQKVDSTIPTTRRSLIDSPYDMFMIPYGNDIRISTPDGIIAPTKETSMALANAIAIEAGSRLYDLQILPYFPIQDLLSYDSTTDIGSLNLASLTSGIDFSYVNISNTSTHVNIIIYPQISIFNFKIQNNFLFSDSASKMNIKNEDGISKKIFHETTRTRICSPNYASMFEFSVGKNNWTVNYFAVSCTYKPQNPFVMITIDFKGLYGTEFNDSRGLILAGDFSLPIINSYWNEYEIQNKNYQLMFDRQIQNMDVLHSIERENMIFSGTKSVLLSSGASALSSMIFGNPLAGLIGGASSAAGTAFSLSYNLAQNANQYAENKQYKIDTFNYQLGNIQALPYTLTKISALNNINKIFPFLEVFEASEEEKEFMHDYLKYKSMRIETVGNLGYYMNPDCDPTDSDSWSFFQAEIFRFDGYCVNDFIANQIYSELAKGVYDKGTLVFELYNTEDVIID